MEKNNWHSLPWQESLNFFQSDEKTGLKEEENKIRQKKWGLNLLPEEKPLSGTIIFLKQFKSPLIYILLFAGIITIILKDYIDSAVIFGAVFFNAIIGFFQENKASHALRELKKVVRYKAEVLREGKLKIIDSENVVAGDIIFLNSGDKVPADGRIIECQNLKINEIALTGEWLSANKKAGILPEETPLADRDNMVYMGTIVESGKAKAMVTATANRTEIGRVAQMLKEVKEEKTPLQKKLDHFAKIIGIIVVIICSCIFMQGIITGEKFLDIFIVSVALAVAAIPEGLPVSLTIVLTIGMNRILKRKGLVKNLLAAETLGSTSIICTDKTATLTEGKMKAGEIIGDKYLALKAAFLTSAAFIENPEEEKEKWIIRGRPTDRALLEAAVDFGIKEKKEPAMKKIAEVLFNSTNKFALSLYEEGKTKTLYACGAPERIIDICNLKKEEKEKLNEKLEALAQKGFRVVASAKKDIFNLKNKLEAEADGMFFCGLITLQDPVRKEVKEVIRICREAGMRPIIVTGDHKLTAKSVAEELGFKIKEENILEGKDLDKLSGKEFDDILPKIKIYARVEPKHKIRIVSAWQDRGEVVAMTGDGINDAPALKKADIGVALGSGTDVAKEISDLILLSDSFDIIVVAVEGGRIIIDNIRKTFVYLLSTSISEVILVSATLFLKFPLPLLAVQILWINLIEGTLPAFGLASEPKEKDIMKRKPEGKNIPILIRESKILIFIIGLISSSLVISLFFYLFFKDHDIDYIRTMIFACLTLESFFYIFSCRSLRKNIWKINFFSNKNLFKAWFFALIMLFLAIYFPPIQVLLRTVPLGIKDWLLFLGFGILGLILIESAKWFFIVRKKANL